MTTKNTNSFKPDWTIEHYVVPPSNNSRVVLSKRENLGDFHIGIEDYMGEGVWTLRKESAKYCGTNAQNAHDRARELWERLKTK